jgi:hypothetical protein
MPIFISSNVKKINQSKLNEKTEMSDNYVSHDGIYISRDTLFSIDKRYKNQITVSLLKFNQNNTVQSSIIKYKYTEGENIMCNRNITTWLNNESLYSYSLRGKNEIIIKCYTKMPKRAWNDFATPHSIKISVKFKIYGDKLVLSGKSHKNFNHLYILDPAITNNHKKVKIGSACN